ncbi:hypothetical protein Tco_0945533 [Tanacetum coccineum]
MSFSKRPDSDAHTDKNVSRDPFLKPTEFKADDYAVLVAHPAPFQKFSKPFLCLIGISRNYTLDEDTYPTFLHDDRTEMGLFTFIHVADPTKVKIGEQKHAEEEAWLLDSTIRVVLLLPVSPDRADSELEVSMEKLFDESGGVDQGDSAAGGGQKTEAEIVAGVRFVDEDNLVAEKPKRPQKKRQAVTDASGSFHPPKKLRSDHETSSRAASTGKSPTVLKQLLSNSILNVESGVEVVATLPFVTSSVSSTPEHESGVLVDSITGLNLRTIGASKRFVISLDSSHHSSTNVPRAEGDSLIRSAMVPPMMTEADITTHVASILSTMTPESGTKVITPVHAFMFHDSESTRTVRPDVASSSYLPGIELFIGSREVKYESLHEVLFHAGTFLMTLCWITWMPPGSLLIIWLLQFYLHRSVTWIMRLCL